MKKSLFILFSLIYILAGCSLKIVPEQVTSGIINQKENSQTVSKNGVSITAKGSTTELYSYNLEGTVASFWVVIDNQTDKEMSFDSTDILLQDNDGRQYYSLTPEKVKEILTKDSYYLMPYPYVGFYYLEDYEKASFYNKFNTQLPYFYEVYPQDIFTKALPAGTIIPKAKISGLVYYRIDINDKKGIKLLVYLKDTSKSSPPDFVFPFKVEK